MEQKVKLPFSNFILKIVALITMTCDHVGYMIPSYGDTYLISRILRTFGRLAFPLFCFMIVEGVMHTRSIKKYLARLGICALAIAIGFAGVEFLPFFGGFSVRDEGNIFVTLLLGALTVYLLNHKKWYIKLLAILPILFVIANKLIINYENLHHVDIWAIPFFIRPQYDYYGLLLMICFYLGYKVASYIKIKNVTINQLVKNIISALMIPLSTLIMILISKIPGMEYHFGVTSQLHTFVAGLFILLYNGRRGYNKPWFQYGCYLYYAIHMGLIYGIFALI